MISPNLAQSRAFGHWSLVIGLVPLEVSKFTPKELCKAIAKFI